MPGIAGRSVAMRRFPHALTANITFQAGDVLVTGASAPVWGYLSELERTMVIGEPSSEQREMFDHMVALQDTAFEAIKPGAKCSDVDRAVRAYYDEHRLWDYWKHHVGHCIGLRYHEGPFLDIGDDTEIKPGMVFTVEPGLVCGWARRVPAFRHGGCDGRRNRVPDVLPPRPREPDAAGMKWSWSDAWLLTAAYFTEENPVSLRGLIGAGDAINHAIFTDNELDHGLTRLRQPDWLVSTATRSCSRMRRCACAKRR